MNLPVTIWHNVEPGGVGFMGYARNHAMAPVFVYVAEVAGGTGHSEPEHAFAVFNSYPDEMHAPQADLPLVERYRANRLRSLSVGDVVQVGNRLYACQPVGFKEIPAGSLNVQPNPHGNFIDNEGEM